jgi:hypothetical protein
VGSSVLSPLSANFTISQDAVDGCGPEAFSFTPDGIVFDQDAGDGTLNVSAPTNCGAWTPVFTVGWIVFSPDVITTDFGPGAGSFDFTVDKNTGSWRSGAIIVGGRQFHVYQNSSDCPAELICRFFPAACGIVGLIDVSHSIRDKVLARSDRGRRYTSLYYQFSREAVGIMLSNPMLLLRSRDILSRYKPVLEAIVAGEQVSLAPEDLDDIDEFLTAFSRAGSPQLQTALDGLRRDLKDPAVQGEFNISIVKAPKREAGGVRSLPGIKFRQVPWTLLGLGGFVFVGFIRARMAPLFKLGKRWFPIFAAGAMLSGFGALKSGSGAPLSAHGPGRTELSTTAALSYLTYLGGSGDDQGTAIATDSAGNAYVAGLTTSSNFPTTAAFQGAPPGHGDAFVSKFNAAGKLVYSTYLGGSAQDNATAIAVDPAGNAYVAGFTSSPDFPVKNAIQPRLKGSVNAFVTKLDASGSISYSTYLGGSLSDMASSIAVDSTGSVYVAGAAMSADFPVAGAPQSKLAGESNAFIAKLSADGSRLVYSTYLGGTDADGASGIAVDSQGQAYITGVTSSRNFPTANAVLPAHAGGFFDGFVAKLNSAGNQFVYSTFLGGRGEDRALRIAVDGPGNAYVTGDTDSSDFPTLNSLQAVNNGSSDAFVVKLNPTGAMVYSTFVGGRGLDGGTGIAADSNGFVYVTGFTASNDFPLVSPVQQASGGAFDAFVLVLDKSGSTALLSSYLGGSGIDSGFGISADSKGGVYLMGQTNSRDLPVSNAAQPSNGGGTSDVFVGRISLGPFIAGAQVSGKKLLIAGIGFDAGATLLLNGDPQKTANDSQNPANDLIAKKSGRLINPGQNVTLQVKNADGSLSNQFSFTRPAG